MRDYTIVGLRDHNIMLAFDGKRVNFPLPVVDGKYPEGAALDRLLSTYVQNARNAVKNQPVASNEAAIRRLVSSPHVTEQREAALRVRNQFLRLTDWTQGRDAPLDDAKLSAWQAYRQALRDLPLQAGFPARIAWPQPPEVLRNPGGVALTLPSGAPAAHLLA